MMTKKLIISFALIAIILLSVQNSAITATQTTNQITANASEYKYVAPDTATITFSVETTNKSSQKAVELNNEKVNTIVNAIKKLLSEDETIKTSVYNLKQEYEYNSLTKKNVFIGYMVTNTITVKLKDTKKTGKIIDIAVKNGATNVNGVSFKLETTDEVCRELTAKAVLKAKKDALSVLAPLGKTIDTVANINYSCSTNSNFKSYRMFNASSSNSCDTDDMISSVNINPGDTKVEATVNVVFTIK